jgi:hypothetical protein
MLKNALLTSMAAGLLLAGCSRNSVEMGAGSDSAFQDTNVAVVVSPERDANNTGRNVRDRSDDAVTPLSQGNSSADLEATRQIRKAVADNDQLSSDAKNVKIITLNGKVTLRGPVSSEQEKQIIATAAESVVGVTSVDNQLEVKTR